MITPGREYVFTHMTNKSSFTFDGVNVLIKRGPFWKKTFPFNSIVNYYMFENNNYRSLYITYTNDSGKLKRVQLMTQLGEIGFRDLMVDLNESIGIKSLNHLTEKEAFAAMKAANPKKSAVFVGMAIIMILTTSFMYPGIRHYFDFGFADAEVQELIAGKDFGTRNLNLMGVPVPESLEETTTSNGSRTTNKKAFVPIVPPGWDYDQPVNVVMEFDKVSDSEFDGIMESSEFVGVVRNIGYEGLEQDHRDAFMDEFDIRVSENAILFEVTGERHNDSLVFWIWVGLNGIFLVIFGISYLKAK